ncbi:glycosyltransferase family 4 protein [Candidatus Falkowbacteria bacterium]|nr:glycosyltransferase family 4 protein [Candidatus Falkowbacteria bacterium]
MKICLIHHSFPPQIGGGETHMYLLASGFSERGHEVTVVTGGDDVSSEGGNGKFSVIRIGNFRDFAKGKISFPYILDDLAKAVSSKDFDVVHVHNFMLGLAYASLSSLIKTKKTVFTFHSTPIPEEGKIIGHFSDYGVEKAFASFIIKLPFYNTLVCPSRYYYDWALKLGAEKSKTKLVYHGIDEKSFIVKKDSSWRMRYGYAADDFIVVCPARMIRRKGILDLVKAIQILDDKKIKLFIPTSVQNGSAEYLALVTDFIQKQNLFDRVKIVIDAENFRSMPQVFANCDLCVLPSHIEGLGIVLLEGMAAGMPVIGSDTFGIREVIREGINGLLSKPNDPKDLAKKILRIRKDGELSAILVNGGKSSVRSDFSLTRQLESLELIYQNN